MTIHYSRNRRVRKQTGDEGTERIKSIGGYRLSSFFHQRYKETKLNEDVLRRKTAQVIIEICLFSLSKDLFMYIYIYFMVGIRGVINGSGTELWSLYSKHPTPTPWFFVYPTLTPIPRYNNF